MQDNQSKKKPVKSTISKKPATPKGPPGPLYTGAKSRRVFHGDGGRSRRIKNNRRGRSGTRRRRGAHSFKSIFKF